MRIEFKERDMQKEQQGFTLIELMVVVSIIGTLAAIAMPAYQDYTIRAQVAEGLTLSAAAKTAISEYYFERGAWPKNDKEAGFSDKHEVIGRYSEHMGIKNNVIEIKYGYDAHPAIFNEMIELTAVANAGSISWTCAPKSGKIKTNHLPLACR